MTPLIIEAAINGSTKKARNPHTPTTPDEIAANALDCVAAGAAVIHSHIEDYTTNGAAAAERYLQGYRKVIAQRPDAILCPTACMGATMEERWRHTEIMAESGLIRMSVLDPGSVNSANSGENGLPGSRRHVYAVSIDEIEYILGILGRHRLGPSIAIYEPSYLHATLAYHRAGKMPPGAMAKLYFAGDHNFSDFVKGGYNYFGLLATPKGFEAYLEMIGDSGLLWSVAVPGGDVTRTGLTRLAIERGGHVRVGLEDYAGDKTPTNRELIEEVVAVARDLGRPVATPEQAARILGLPR
ncbi:MAG TPA: 3-keto-5-aminohexanoate cleavage protein [Alphaproteobacteria bacterium]|nr:3-keto-5-aminohexanoate cleavage protein [Alphaproteobacteria bacterium]